MIASISCPAAHRYARRTSSPGHAPVGPRALSWPEKKYGGRAPLQPRATPPPSACRAALHVSCTAGAARVKAQVRAPP
ncbi:hypothetical protein ACFYY8_20740 [Streptosporangium sp. NPDC001559]|uniref:hypothetical protein n=1 Tax=Streptosporangium sp. NPDC001559 TaxID=3366187 RepID=UPI0036EC58CD